MFTGIITDIGVIKSIKKKKEYTTISIECNLDIKPIALGASIACSGTCLTVTKKEKLSKKTLLWLDLSPETLEKSTHNFAKVGDKINLEKSLKLGDELGGHMVSGHVDLIGEVKKIEKSGKSKSGENWIVAFSISKNYSKFISDKGSITINGVSLTINKTKLNKNSIDFWINIIPHTLQNTNLVNLKEKSKVNIEVDLISRYLSKLINPKFL